MLNLDLNFLNKNFLLEFPPCLLFPHHTSYKDRGLVRVREGSGEEEVEGTRRWAVSGAAVVSSFAPGRHPVSKRQSRDEGHCG